VRESGGGIQHLVVKKITGEPEEWNQAGAEANWDTTLESLRRNLGARSIRLVEEDGMMKIL
jgi:hypothetical protein